MKMTVTGTCPAVLILGSVSHKHLQLDNTVSRKGVKNNRKRPLEFISITDKKFNLFPTTTL